MNVGIFIRTLISIDKLYLNSWCNHHSMKWVLFAFNTAVKKPNKETSSDEYTQHSVKWGKAKIVIQVKHCTMLLNEHILIAQDPRGNKLLSHSKHGRFIYWPWRVLFIQIEIKRQRGRKSFPGLIYHHEVNRSHRENITLRTTEIMSVFPLTGLLTNSVRGHSKGSRPPEQKKKTTSPICKLAENVHWSVMIRTLRLLMSIKVTVMELAGWRAQARGSASPELAVKSWVPRVLYMSPGSASLCPPPHTQANLLKCQRDKTRWIQCAGPGGVKRH